LLILALIAPSHRSTYGRTYNQTASAASTLKTSSSHWSHIHLLL
jgi:hypothetical protein